MIFRVNRLLAVPFPALRRLIGLCSLAAAFGLIFAPPAAAKDALVIGHQDNTASLDPAKAYETTPQGLLASIVYDQLVGFAGDNMAKPIPELAESWDVSEDGMIWTFRLRQGVKFANGNPVNADAVVFSLRRVIKIAAETAWLLTQFGLSEQTITKIDDQTVQIALDKPYAPTLFLSCLALSIGSVLDPIEVMAHEQNGDLGNAWLEEHSAGSGAYVIETAVKQDRFVFRANDAYWGGKPPWPQLVMRHIPDAMEQMALLESGDIDIAWNLGQDETQQLAENTDIQLVEALWPKLYWTGMNLGYEPFAKPHVRKAVRYAIDYDGLVAHVLRGAGEVVQTFLAPGLLGYAPENRLYAYDPERAKALLAEAGYPNGFDVELDCFNFSPWVEVAQQLRHNLAQVGIRVTVNQLPPKDLFPKVSQRAFQMTLIGWLFDYQDPDANAKSFAHCDSLGDDATIKLRAWNMRYLLPDISKIVEQAALERDLDKRAAMYQQVAAQITEDGPFAFLFVPIRYYGIRAEVAPYIGKPEFIAYDFPVLKFGTQPSAK